MAPTNTTPPTAVITGSSSGLGLATAKLFAKHGWRVVATMRNPDAVQALDGLERVSKYQLDVTDLSAIRRVATDVIDAYGQVDLLVNNAGYGLGGPLEALSDAQLQRQLNTNLLGPMRVTQAFLGHMRARRQGTIVNITSIGGLIAMPFFSAYHATKWGLEGWSESMWFELKTHGVRIKTVSPGGISTDFAGRSLDFNAHDAYAEPIQNMMAAVSARTDGYSTAAQIAAVVYQAATDDRDQLRYVAGDDAQAMYDTRQEVGDQAFMQASLERFFASVHDV